MCVAIAKPRGVKLIKEATLDACEWSNRDGMGLAWAENGKVHIKKDFKDVKEMHKWIGENLTSETPMLIHFRQETSGGVKVGLRHPFPLSNKEEDILAPTLTCDVALVHNGIIWVMDDKAKLSDTATFVKEILSDELIKEGLRDNLALQALVCGMIGTSNKLAILWGDGKILTFGEFEKDRNGCLFSNSQYKTFKGFDYGKTYSSNTLQDDRNTYWPNRKDNEEAYYCVICYKEMRLSESLPFTDRDSVLGDRVCFECARTFRHGKDEIEDSELKCYSCLEPLEKEDVAGLFKKIGGKEEVICKICIGGACEVEGA